MRSAEPQNDAETIRQLCKRFVTAANTSDAELWTSLYTPDAVLMPPNHAPVNGSDAIRGYMEREFFALFDVVLVDETDELIVEGALAIRRGTGSMTLTPKNGDPVIEEQVKYLEVWRRQPDGAWKLFRDMFSSNEPGP